MSIELNVTGMPVKFERVACGIWKNGAFKFYAPMWLDPEAKGYVTIYTYTEWLAFFVEDHEEPFMVLSVSDLTDGQTNCLVTGDVLNLLGEQGSPGLRISFSR